MYPSRVAEKIAPATQKIPMTMVHIRASNDDLLSVMFPPNVLVRGEVINAEIIAGMPIRIKPALMPPNHP